MRSSLSAIRTWQALDSTPYPCCLLTVALWSRYLQRPTARDERRAVPAGRWPTPQTIAIHSTPIHSPLEGGRDKADIGWPHIPLASQALNPRLL
eukprot:scaffold830_cov112-Isochrysis_galbana.AAC.5